MRCADLFGGDGAARFIAADGATVELWRARLDWICRGTPVRLVVLALDAIPLPEPEPSEPPAGAIARVATALRTRGGVLGLANPTAALGERIAHADGVRLFGIADAEDERRWDAALALGLPVYGVRGTVCIEAVRKNAMAALSGLAYGAFRCEEGTPGVIIGEDRGGVNWQGPDDLEAAVIVRDGFEAAVVQGGEGFWVDRGTEGTVRLALRCAAGRCWTQPRFIAPKRAAHG